MINHQTKWSMASIAMLLEGTVKSQQLNVSEHVVSPNDGRNRGLSGFNHQ